MKVIVAGSRNFIDYKFVENILNQRTDIDEIVCGLARGADNLGRQWAHLHHVPVTTFPAQWGKYGKAAGMMRNTEMAEYADYLIAFWDGRSPGTKDMIEKMNKLNKHGEVYIKEQI